MPKESEPFTTIFNNRKSIRKYDASIKIPREEMKQILVETCRTPSSLNMQPWRFVVVDTDEGKTRIKESMKYNALQVETASAVVFVFGDLKGINNKDKILSQSETLGFMPKEVKEHQSKVIDAFYQNATSEELIHQITLDSGLISMGFMLVAKSFGYDTCPIGGFDKEHIADILGLDKKRYVPMLSFSIGTAQEEGHPSYRLPIEDITEWR